MTAQQIDPQTLYIEAQAAKYLGCAPTTLRKARVTGELFGHPAPVFLKMGRAVRYQGAAIAAFLEQFAPARNTAEAQGVRAGAFQAGQPIATHGASDA
ncbi:hypothetical protein D9M68_744800 [compost metagenome]